MFKAAFPTEKTVPAILPPVFKPDIPTLFPNEKTEPKALVVLPKKFLKLTEDPWNTFPLFVLSPGTEEVLMLLTVLKPIALTPNKIP